MSRNCRQTLKRYKSGLTTNNMEFNAKMLLRYSSGQYEPGDDTGPGYMSSSGTTIEEKAHVCDLGTVLHSVTVQTLSSISQQRSPL